MNQKLTGLHWQAVNPFKQQQQKNHSQLRPRHTFVLQYQYNFKQTNNENWEKYQLGDYHLIQYQILRTKIIINLWQTVRRLTKEILGMKRLTVSPLASNNKNKVKYSDWPSLLEHKSWISHKIKQRNFQKNFHLPEIASDKTRKQVSFQNHHTLKNIQLQHWK